MNSTTDPHLPCLLHRSIITHRTTIFKKYAFALPRASINRYSSNYHPLQILISSASCIDQPLLIELPSDFVIPLSYTEFSLSSCFTNYSFLIAELLWHQLTIHIMEYFIFYSINPATMSIGYSFVIPELLWHQWQLYYQQYPPLALMETSKNSPPLTIMTKDNLLYQCCTHFDIGFPVFLLSDNYPCQHISSLC